MAMRASPSSSSPFPPRPREQTTSIASLWAGPSCGRPTWPRRRTFRWRSVDGLEIQGWLYRAARARSGTIVLCPRRPDLRWPKIESTPRFSILSRRASTCWRRTIAAAPASAWRSGVDQAGWLGRPRAGRHPHRDRGADRRRDRRARPCRRDRHVLGGYSSWCAITRCPPELVAAAAPICGMTDLVIDYETTRPDLRPYSDEMLGGRPDQVARALPRALADPLHGQHSRPRADRPGPAQIPTSRPENVRAVRASPGRRRQTLRRADLRGRGARHRAAEEPAECSIAGWREFFVEALLTS